jgi:hypothetical protein
MRSLCLSLVFIGACIAASATAENGGGAAGIRQTTGFDRKTALATSQAAIGRTLAGMSFYTTDGGHQSDIHQLSPHLPDHKPTPGERR